MSRSLLHDKFKNKHAKDYCNKKNKHNPHQQDETPKNKPSKYISSRCANVEWLQESPNFGGHKIKKEGHRMVSGIVRAKVTKEIRDEIEEALYEENIENIN